MKNLEQRRAAHAWPRALDLTPAEVNGLPPLIVNNGLLATAAFAAVKDDEDRPKRPGMKRAFDAVADHLAEQGLLAADKGTVEGLLQDLPARQDSAPLQRATTEALAYLNYLKRFARTEPKSTKEV